MATNPLMELVEQIEALMRQTNLEWSIAGNVNDSGHFSLMVKFPYYETPQAVKSDGCAQKREQ